MRLILAVSPLPLLRMLRRTCVTGGEGGGSRPAQMGDAQSASVVGGEGAYGKDCDDDVEALEGRRWSGEGDCVPA